MADFTLEQLEKTYAINPARVAVLAELKEELEYWKKVTSGLKVWVFGPYLGIAPEPDKIDVLLMAVLKPFEPGSPSRGKHDKVRVVFRLVKALTSKEDMIKMFNSQPVNVENGISLRPEHVSELILG
jgi:hypothetical protein